MSKNIIKIELTDQIAYVEMTGSTVGMLRNFCLLFEKYPITKQVFKDAVTAHDQWEKDAADKQRKANEN